MYPPFKPRWMLFLRQSKMCNRFMLICNRSPRSHAGFDASGNVTDPTQALQTVQGFQSKAAAIRQAGVRDAGKALREAMQAFRQANQPATPAPSSTNG